MSDPLLDTIHPLASDGIRDVGQGLELLIEGIWKLLEAILFAIPILAAKLFTILLLLLFLPFIDGYTAIAEVSNATLWAEYYD
jgi:hypothetical protein